MRISRMLLTVARTLVQEHWYKNIAIPQSPVEVFVAAIVEMATFNEETEADFSWENSG